MRYFIVALVVSLAWSHQDWFIWPFLGELYEQQNYVPAFVNDLSEDEQLAYTAAFARNREHELVMGLPLGVHFQMFLSFATAAVALLAVWKAWPMSWNAGPKPATVAIVTAIVARPWKRRS